MHVEGNRAQLHVVGSRLLFSAQHPIKGFELYQMELPFAVGHGVGSGCGSLQTVPQLGGGDPSLAALLTMTSSKLEPSSVAALVLGAPNALRIPRSACTLYAWPPTLVVDQWAINNKTPRQSRLPIPRVAALKGLRIALQTWNLGGSIGLRMSNGYFGQLGN